MQPLLSDNDGKNYNVSSTNTPTGTVSTRLAPINCHSDNANNRFPITHDEWSVWNENESKVSSANYYHKV